MDIFEALAFEISAGLNDRIRTSYPSKPIAAHYHEAYLDLRVKRAKQMMLQVALWD